MSPQTPKAAHKGHIRGLDGLRGIAVLIVFLFHERLLLPFGWVGVQLFFVLSGFLITRILLRYRTFDIRGYLWTFYGRRTVRIFPLYYAYLAGFAVICFVLSFRSETLPAQAHVGLEQLPWAGLYGYNFLHAVSGVEHSRVLTHFWSLAVEEQFYLVWPILLWTIPLRHLGRFLWTIVLAGPPLRLGTYLLSPQLGMDPAMSSYVLPWCQADAFALGALVSQQPFPHAVRRLPFLTVGVLALSLATANPQDSWTALGLALPLEGLGRATVLYSMVNLIFAVLLSAVWQSGYGLGVLEHPLLTRTGVISYGLYVFHFPIQGATAVAIPYLALPMKLVLDLLLSVLASELSFRLLEQPFLSLKSRFFGTSTERQARSDGRTPTADSSPGLQIPSSMHKPSTHRVVPQRNVPVQTRSKTAQ